MHYWANVFHASGLLFATTGVASVTVASSSSSTGGSTSGSSSTLSTGAIIGIAIGGAAVLAIICVGLYYQYASRSGKEFGLRPSVFSPQSETHAPGYV
jgi:hypothetical protein